MDAAAQQTNGTLMFFAKLISYILHPIFIPIYVVAFLVYMHPTLFSGFSAWQKMQTVVITAINMVAFPLLAIFLTYKLGFISSIYMNTQKDRIIPYIMAGIFFFWGFTIFRQQNFYPSILPSFLLGVFLSSSMALIANIYLKVSMHAIGMAGWLALFLIMLFSNSMLMTWPLLLVVLLTGLVLTARMMLNTHTQKEIYLGLLIGIIAQLAAAYFIL